MVYNSVVRYSPAVLVHSMSVCGFYNVIYNKCFICVNYILLNKCVLYV